MIHIDGRMGEGGGQVLRTSVALSAALGVPVHIEHIRGGRKRSGLLRQHLTAVRAMREVCNGSVEGAQLGSTEMTFYPGEVRAGEYEFSVGTAGSAVLVLQTVLPPLLLANGESRVVVEGGTHNPWAPPFEALERSIAPQLRAMGADVAFELERYGFYPAGGGKISACIAPVTSPRKLELLERGPIRARDAEVLLAHLPEVIAEREIEALREKLPWVRTDSIVNPCESSAGPGNLVHVTIQADNVTEVFTSFGERHVRSEQVGRSLGKRVQKYLQHEVPVGEFLSDQLMLPMALLAGGRYRTAKITRHAATNADVINLFLPDAVSLETVGQATDVHVRSNRTS